jgi:hypothetical protein
MKKANVAACKPSQHLRDGNIMNHQKHGRSCQTRISISHFVATPLDAHMEGGPSACWFTPSKAMIPIHIEEIEWKSHLTWTAPGNCWAQLIRVFLFDLLQYFFLFESVYHQLGLVCFECWQFFDSVACQSACSRGRDRWSQKQPIDG